MPYRMTQNSDNEPNAKVGTTVYLYNGYDYGLANDDTRTSGIKHISVTLNHSGKPPFFTVPKRDLEVLP